MDLEPPSANGMPIHCRRTASAVRSCDAGISLTCRWVITQISADTVNSMPKHRRIIVTESDFSLLRRLASHPHLAAELDKAAVVDSRRVSPDVVTMNSRVLFEDESTANAAQSRSFSHNWRMRRKIHLGARAGGHCLAWIGSGTIHRLAVSRRDETFTARSEDYLSTGGSRGAKPARDGKTTCCAQSRLNILIDWTDASTVASRRRRYACHDRGRRTDLDTVTASATVRRCCQSDAASAA